MASPWNHYLPYIWPQPTYYPSGGVWYWPHYTPAFVQPNLPHTASATRRLRNLPLELHRILGGHQRPSAVWDISFPPGAARRVTSQGGVVKLSSAVLKAPASNPPTTRMRIFYEPRNWTININIPPDAPDKFISIDIVLDAIYAAFQEELEPDEWDIADKRDVHRRMCARLARGPPLIKVDGRAIRLDSMREKTIFMGLRPGGPHEEDWSLSLGPRRDDI